MENAKSISLSAVHRLGKPPHLLPKAQHRPRDVLVKFVSLSDRNNIWSKRMSLKNTKYFLSEDYPAIVQQRIRILMPYLNQAKKSHSVAKCALVGDKLLVDGKTFTVDTVKDEGPRWQSGNTLASHLCGRGSIPVMAVSGKAGSCLPLVGSLQYTTLANSMYWFPLPFQLPVVI